MSVRVSAIALVALLNAVGTAGDTGICAKADGSLAPCKPGNEACPKKPGLGRRAGCNGRFHVISETCALNDPNAPVYDPVHDVYHIHFQNHAGLCHAFNSNGTCDPLSGGRTFGHAVSRDFAHWAHVPISIWNDQPYDRHDIYTGSATVVNNQVVIVYPGICMYKDHAPGCPGGVNLALATPSDPNDPLQRNWTKTGFATNPIVKGPRFRDVGGGDPSSAWQTAAGEWRFTTAGGFIFGSMDFKNWYMISQQKGFTPGECPSFFPLPRITPGAEPPAPGVPVPTHVYKVSHASTMGPQDFVQVGHYIENGPNQSGNWTPMPGVKEQLVDAGAIKIEVAPFMRRLFYASKDFYDAAKQRRIIWGFAEIFEGFLTLPREITWHPALQQLVFSPVPEQDNLRASEIGSMESQTLLANTPTPLGDMDPGNMTEVLVSFRRPQTATILKVTIPTTHLPWAHFLQGISLQFSYVPPTSNAAGISEIDVGCAACNVTQKLKLLATDQTLDLRVYIDGAVVEAFFNGGRVVMTLKTYDLGGTPRITLEADAADVIVDFAGAWQVGSIWVSPEEVLATPRPDSRVFV
eukprot:TRINITY_DN10765_c0_g5_i1.p1 TRINITY_DN10765_c0_g5~~TRINITY_DN10765_c0_g5_i1.p1  ORF type:complete len:596 (+),score=64.51 TRINITY_DN10765_c0_g5_i1:57-1790(+)